MARAAMAWSGCATSANRGGFAPVIFLLDQRRRARARGGAGLGRLCRGLQAALRACRAGRRHRARQPPPSPGDGRVARVRARRASRTALATRTSRATGARGCWRAARCRISTSPRARRPTGWWRSRSRPRSAMIRASTSLSSASCRNTRLPSASSIRTSCGCMSWESPTITPTWRWSISRSGDLRRRMKAGLAPAECAPLRGAAGRGARRHPRGRHPAPRPQARQRHAAHRGAAGADRLRHGQAGRAADGADRQGADLRHPALHEPGAGPRPAPRCAQRPVQPRRRALRDADRRQALSRRQSDDGAVHAPQYADSAAGAGTGVAAAAAGPAAGQGSRTIAIRTPRKPRGPSRKRASNGSRPRPRGRAGPAAR